jgi:DNA mismatch endonuclease (patch repair protein)
MRLARRRDTAPEVAIRRALHARGLRFRVDFPVLRRTRADICFPRQRIAVYVDGCFWHGCPIHGTWPANNAEWWREKIERNRQRDAQTGQTLEEAGWTVMRFWEHEDPEIAAAAISALVSDRKT